MKEKCTSCGEPLVESRIVWLELSQTDGNYYHHIPHGHVSQGCFPFGTVCAKKETQKSEKK